MSSTTLALVQILLAAQLALWPDAPMPAWIAGQVQAESAWNPRAELKTSREHGIGLSQCTRAYDAQGRLRFDRCAEAKAKYPELAGWTDPFDPKYHLQAVVLMDRDIYQRIQGAANKGNRVAMTIAAYNRGEGGLAQDRAVCRNTPGCDPGQWFGHVENTSTLPRTRWPGYGRSAFEINRSYVRKVFEYRLKYVEVFES